MKITIDVDNIRAIRKALGYSAKRMGDTLGMSESSYRLKETGKVNFSDREKIIVTEVLGLSTSQFNEVFFDGKLPFGKEVESSGKRSDSLT